MPTLVANAYQLKALACVLGVLTSENMVRIVLGPQVNKHGRE